PPAPSAGPDLRRDDLRTSEAGPFPSGAPRDGTHGRRGAHRRGFLRPVRGRGGVPQGDGRRPSEPPRSRGGLLPELRLLPLPRTSRGPAAARQTVRVPPR